MFKGKPYEMKHSQTLPAKLSKLSMIVFFLLFSVYYEIFALASSRPIFLLYFKVNVQKIKSSEVRQVV